jgi:hypothetical protein
MIILKAVGLRGEENNTIKEGDKIIAPSIIYNNKPILVDYDLTKSILGQYILLKIDSTVLSCTYQLLDKYIAKAFSSKINTLVLKLITLLNTPELHSKVKSIRLNELLSKQYKRDDFGIEDMINETTSEKWSQICKLTQNQTYEKSLIKFKIKFDVFKIENRNILKFHNIKDPKDNVEYICKQSYIQISFPMYELLVKNRSDKLLGIDLTKRDIFLLTLIYQYIFENIDDKSYYKFIDNPIFRKEDMDHSKQYHHIEDKPLRDTFSLMKAFVKMSKRINNIIEELSFMEDMDNEKFELEDIEELIGSIEQEQFMPPIIDFEHKNDAIKELKKYKFDTLESLSNSLNNKKTESSKKLAQPQKTFYKRRTKSIRRNSFISPSLIALQAIPSSRTEHTLDLTEESFKKVFPEDFKFTSAYMVAGAGSGKSELLKVLALKDIQDESKNFVLIDGGEKLALELAKLVPPERLIFLDESLKEGNYFSINPLNVEDKSDKSLSSRSKHLAKSFELLLEGSLSDNMEAVLVPIIYVLMHAGGYDIFDLKRFMDKENYDELKELSLKCPSKVHRDFIINDLHRIKSVKQTLDAVFMKLQNLLSDDSLTKCISGENTFDLEKEVNESGRIIICNVDSPVLGIFLVAMIQGIAEKRDVHDFIHTNLYIDEFQEMVSPSSTKILNKLRKKGLHLTMANQDLEDIKEIRSNVFTNTNVKVVGKSSYENLKIMAKAIQVDVKELENLGVGEFYIKVGIEAAIKIKVTDQFIDQNGAMSDDAWEKVVELQLSNYYKQRNHKYKVQTLLSIDSENEIVFSPENDEF